MCIGDASVHKWMLSISRRLWVNRWSALQPYESTHVRMEQCALHVAQGISQENLWLLSHSSVYTVGRSLSHLRKRALQGIPVCHSSRGGDITYHGPEQRMIYPIIAIRDRGIPLVTYLDVLEQWIIACLESWGVKAIQDPRRRGVWVGSNKICALGIAVKQGIAFHGMALNIYEAPSSFGAIIPCGIEGPFGITSLEALGVRVSLEEVDRTLWQHCPFMV
jgi:lipoyl(octanoyl) transferase